MKGNLIVKAAGTVLIGAVAVISACLCGCSGSVDKVGKNTSYTELLAESDRYARVQEYEIATDYAIKALDRAKKSGSAAAESEVLSHMAALDLVTWRDEQAWKHACEAEELSRGTGIDSLTALALLQKGKVRLCGAVTEEDARDDEALGYLEEALKLSYGCLHIKADILYNISQVYVGRNRFNNPINPVLYSKAGDYLDAGDAIAQECGFEDLMAKSYTYRMRYYRQGGRLQEGIDCCRKVLEISAPDDYLHRSQALNQLVMFYALAGDVEQSALAHQQYVYDIEHFMQQKADARLQEMESRYNASLKQTHINILRRWIAVLILAIILLVLVVTQFFVSNRRIAAANRVKEALLRFISKDFTSLSFNKKVTESFRELAPLNDESIRMRCAELFGEPGGLSDEVADYIVNLIHERESAGSRFGLTAREMEIVRLSRDGLSAAEIADKLSISVYTVNNHKQNIYSKMNVRSNAEMMRVASEAGLM